MTTEEKIEALRVVIGDSTDDESVLRTYLKFAAKKILAKAYPYDKSVTEVPVEYECLQIEIAAYLMNKRGAEGQSSHTENGVKRVYENGDVPNSMLRSVVPYCGVV